jgi:choline dehydrogenase-like flavoprotein
MTEPDVVIIGSGPAGVSAAWPLVAAGRRVLMLDAGVGTIPNPAPERPSLRNLRQDPAGWRHLLGDDLRGLRKMTDVSPKLRMIPDAAFLSRFQDGNGLEPHGFSAIGILGRGGLSNFWGAVSCAYGPEDLVGSPVGAADLAPALRRVAARIGLSGCADDDLAPSHGTDLPLQPPLPLSPLAEALLARYQRHRNHLSLRLGRNRSAVLTQPLNGRAACDRSGACMWGCARGAIYSAASEVPELQRHANFALRDGFVVKALSVGGRGFVIGGTDARTGLPLHLEAATVVLAAGVLPTTRLALQCLERFDEAMPLQNCPAFAMALAVPSWLGRPLPDPAFGMAQLAFRMPLGPEPGDFAFGLLFGADAMAAPDLTAHMPLTRPGAAGLLRSLLPTLLIGLVYLPGSYSRNQVCLKRGNERMADRLVIDGGHSPAFDPVQRTLVRRLSRDFRRLGAYLLPGSAKPYPPGAEIHYGATLPMGARTTSSGEVTGRPGLFIADASALSRLSSKHNTFTVMANADRIGTLLAQRPT